VTNLTIGITPRTAASPARLRADGIQDAALIQLGRMLAEGDDGARRLIDALETLGTVSYDAAPGELNGALDDVRSLGRLDAAVMDLSDADVHQLADEAVHAGAIADGSVTRLPGQREGGAAA
jgi:hypothetical protein